MSKNIEIIYPSTDKDWNDWEFAMKSFGNVAFEYHPLKIKYDEYYLGQSFLKNLSFFLRDRSSGNLVAICPLYLTVTSQGARVFSYIDKPLPAPAFDPGLPLGLGQKVASYVIEHIEKLAVEYNACAHYVEWSALEGLSGQSPIIPFISFGYKNLSTMTSIVDLARSEADLWSRVRESYHSLINGASKSCTFHFFFKDNFRFEDGEIYRDLHRLAAGRVTRPLETFHNMYEWVTSGNGMLTIQYLQGQPVLALLFNFYGGHVNYYSAADHPDYKGLNGGGIMHAGIWRSLLALKEKGLRWLEMGEQVFSPDWANATFFNDKMVGIAKFKRGFGGKIYPLLRGERFFSSEYCLSSWKLRSSALSRTVV